MAVQRDSLHVNLGASQTRKRLKGRGFGVKHVQTAGKGKAVIIHTATGGHLKQLRSLFHDVLEPETGAASDAESDEA